MKMQTKIFLFFRKFDWFLFSLVLAIVFIGLAAIYSVDLSISDSLVYFPTQLLALVLAIILFFIISSLHFSFFRSVAKIAYATALILLFSVLIFGQNIRGTTGWFRVAGFSFQPAEFAKLALVIFLAWWISKQARRFDRWQFILTSGFFTFLLVFLIILQPDLGSALVLLGLWVLLLFLTGTKKRFLIFLFSVFVFVSCFAWLFLFKDYQKNRLLTFVDPARDPLGAGYNVTQSIIAIGSGNFFGRGLGFGSQSQLHFLPEAQTDFIFSVVGEELGFVGAMVLLILYFLLIWRLYFIASSANGEFSVYLVLGVLLIYLIQIIINIGGAIGFLPVTGVTLPFLSYGGSSMIINFILLGIAESVVVSHK